MVVIRLARGGAKKRPFFNVVVADSRSRRDGRFIERVGFYNPIAGASEEGDREPARSRGVDCDVPRVRDAGRPDGRRGRPRAPLVAEIESVGIPLPRIASVVGFGAPGCSIGSGDNLRRTSMRSSMYCFVYRNLPWTCRRSRSLRSTRCWRFRMAPLRLMDGC